VWASITWERETKAIVRTQAVQTFGSDLDHPDPERREKGEGTFEGSRWKRWGYSLVRIENKAIWVRKWKKSWAS